MLRRILRGLALLLVVSILTLAGFIFWNWPHVQAFPAILPAFTAKEHCSCRFVMRQGTAYCERYSRQWLPISSLAVNEDTRTVTVEGLWTTRSARWLSPRDGCRLDRPPPS